MISKKATTTTNKSNKRWRRLYPSKHYSNIPLLLHVVLLVLSNMQRLVVFHCIFCWCTCVVFAAETNNENHNEIQYAYQDNGSSKEARKDAKDIPQNVWLHHAANKKEPRILRNIPLSESSSGSLVSLYEEMLKELLRTKKLQQLDEDLYGIADWYISYGYIHRLIIDEKLRDTHLLQADDDPDDSSQNDDDDIDDGIELNINKSIESYKNAITIYNRIIIKLQTKTKQSSKTKETGFLTENHLEMITAKYNLALIVFSIAEVYYSLIPQLSSSSPDYSNLALEYYTQSYDKFNNIITQIYKIIKDEDLDHHPKDNNDIDSKTLEEDELLIALTSILNEVEISYANCCMKLGTIVLTMYNTQHHPMSSSTKIPLNMNKKNGLPEEIPIDLFDTMDTKDLLSIIADPKKLDQIIQTKIDEIVAKLVQDEIPTLSDSILQSKEYLFEAIKLFRQHIQMKDNINSYNDGYNYNEDDEEDIAAMIPSSSSIAIMNKLNMKHSLATCLSSIAAIYAMEHNFSKSSEYYEESLQLNREYIHQLEEEQQQQQRQQDDGDEEVANQSDNKLIIDDARIAIADSLYGLADTYLQQGKYDIAKERYRRAMQWNSEYDIPQASSSINPDDMQQEGGGDSSKTDIDDSISQYEALLQEYENKFGVNSMDGGIGVGRLYDNDDEDYYKSSRSTDSSSSTSSNDGYGLPDTKDYGYEGDVHASLGALYLTNNDFVTAASHLVQAIRLYELAGDASETPMADVKLNLALLQLRLQEYDESADTYDEALDIYQRIHGNDVNPLSSSTKMRIALEQALGGVFGSMADEDDDDSIVFDFSSIGNLFKNTDSAGKNNDDNTNDSKDSITADEIKEGNDRKTTYEKGQQGATTTDSSSSTSSKVPQSDSESNIERSDRPASHSADSSLSSAPEKAGKDATTSTTSKDNSHTISKVSNDANKIYPRKVALPGGTSIDLRTFLHQNDSLKEEL